MTVHAIIFFFDSTLTPSVLIKASALLIKVTTEPLRTMLRYGTGDQAEYRASDRGSMLRKKNARNIFPGDIRLSYYCQKPQVCGKRLKNPEIK